MSGIHRLNQKKITSAKLPNGKKEQLLADGGNLYLRLRLDGSKSWMFIYTHPTSKKRTKLGIGAFPQVTLSSARAKAEEYRIAIANKIDPKTVIHSDKKALKLTFQVVAEEWFEKERKESERNTEKKIEDAKQEARKRGYELDNEDIKAIRNKRKSIRETRMRLDKHLYPRLSDTPIGHVTAERVIDVLTPLEKKGIYETVKRVTSIAKRVMRFAMSRRYITDYPLDDISESFIQPVAKRMPTVPPCELNAVMAIMADANMKVITRCAFEIQLHTLNRPIETAQMTWRDIDFDRQVWVISGYNMKNGLSHTIPLSYYALAILKYLKPITGDQKYVFPSDTDRSTTPHICSQSVNAVLKRAGLKGKVVSHGLRSIGCTQLNEKKFNPDAIEICLSHLDDDRVRRIYNNAEHLEERRKIMDYWSDFIVESTGSSYSIAGRFKNEQTKT